MTARDRVDRARGRDRLRDGIGIGLDRFAPESADRFNLRRDSPPGAPGIATYLQNDARFVVSPMPQLRGIYCVDPSENGRIITLPNDVYAHSSHQTLCPPTAA